MQARSPRACIQEAARSYLCGFDVGLIERVDAQHPAGDRRRVLPDDELRSQRSADEHLALMALPEVELVRLVDDAHDLHVGRSVLDLRGDG